MVFTGLTGAGVEYYLRRLGCGSGLNLISIPADTAEHVGWVRAANPEELETQSDRLARQFSEQADQGRQPGLVVGHGVKADFGIVRGAFDRDLGDGRVRALRGSQFDDVVIYPHPDEAQGRISP